MAKKRDRDRVATGAEGEPGPKGSAGVSRRGVIKGGAAAIAVVGAGAFQEGCAQEHDAGAVGEAHTAHTAVGQIIPAADKLSPYFRALLNMTQYTRAANKAARDALLDELGGDPDNAELHSALAYNYVQDHRNAWNDVDDRLAEALHQAETGVKLADNYFTRWALAVVYRYRGRGLELPQEHILALREYQKARSLLKEDKDAKKDEVRHDFNADFAEFMVYLLMPDDGIRRIKGVGNKLWYKWIQAFAHHQNEEPEEGIKLLVPHLPFRVPEYNDMYLILAASYARAGEPAKAKEHIKTFNDYRAKIGEPEWTAKLERERGCFVVADGDEENYWIESFKDTGLPAG